MTSSQNGQMREDSVIYKQCQENIVSRLKDEKPQLSANTIVIFNG